MFIYIKKGIFLIIFIQPDIYSIFVFKFPYYIARMCMAPNNKEANQNTTI